MKQTGQRLADLMGQYPRQGIVRWIGIRHERRAPVEAVKSAALDPGRGLIGDHYSGRSRSRQVTLIDAAHLDAVAGYLGRVAIDPADLRRNIVVEGLNLLALKAADFHLGEALVRYRGQCHPCSRMEQILGAGGYNAMRGHGGICAEVITPGHITLGDAVTPLLA